MKVYLAIDIPSLKTTKEALMFGQKVSEHIVINCNEENLIQTISYQVKPKKGE